MPQVKEQAANSKGIDNGVCCLSVQHSLIVPGEQSFFDRSYRMIGDSSIGMGCGSLHITGKAGNPGCNATSVMINDLFRVFNLHPKGRRRHSGPLADLRRW